MKSWILVNTKLLPGQLNQSPKFPLSWGHQCLAPPPAHVVHFYHRSPADYKAWCREGGAAPVTWAARSPSCRAGEGRSCPTPPPSSTGRDSARRQRATSAPSGGPRVPTGGTRAPGSSLRTPHLACAVTQQGRATAGLGPQRIST